MTVIDLALASEAAGRRAYDSVAPVETEGAARAMLACLGERRVLEALEAIDHGCRRFLDLCDLAGAETVEARAEMAAALANLRRRELIAREPGGYALTALGRLVAPYASQLRRFTECYDSHAALSPSQELWIVRRLAFQLVRAGANEEDLLELLLARDGETLGYIITFRRGRARVRVLCDSADGARPLRRGVRVRIDAAELRERVRRGDVLTGSWRPFSRLAPGLDGAFAPA